ncbi:hypothetical protein MKX03_027787, partial [Papaver bracteatum]
MAILVFTNGGDEKPEFKFSISIPKLRNRQTEIPLMQKIQKQEQMSSIFSHLIRVSLVSSFTTQRTSFYQKSSSSSTSSGKHDHYQHGIPGIPTDGKVVLLKNSNNGAQVYLVGTIHYYEPTTQTVKKVINYVRPDTIA